MRRATLSVLVSAGLSLAATGFARAQAPAARTVQIRCSLAVPSGVTEPLTMFAQIYRVGRNNLGEYRLEGKPRNLMVNVMPAAGGTGSGSFDIDLELGNDIEYELKVVPLDKDGKRRTDGRYYFASPDVAVDFFDTTVALRPGEINDVIVTLRWIPGERQSKSNLLQIVPRPGLTDYFLALYVNDPTNIDPPN